MASSRASTTRLKSGSSDSNGIDTNDIPAISASTGILDFPFTELGGGMDVLPKDSISNNKNARPKPFVVLLVEASYTGKLSNINSTLKERSDTLVSSLGLNLAEEIEKAKARSIENIHANTEPELTPAVDNENPTTTNDTDPDNQDRSDEKVDLEENQEGDKITPDTLENKNNEMLNENEGDRDTLENENNEMLNENEGDRDNPNKVETLEENLETQPAEGDNIRINNVEETIDTTDGIVDSIVVSKPNEVKGDDISEMEQFMLSSEELDVTVFTDTKLAKAGGKIGDVTSMTNAFIKLSEAYDGNDKQDSVIVLSGFPTSVEELIEFCRQGGRIDSVVELAVDLKSSVSYAVDESPMVANSTEGTDFKDPTALENKVDTETTADTDENNITEDEVKLNIDKVDGAALDKNDNESVTDNVKEVDTENQTREDGINEAEDNGDNESKGNSEPNKDEQNASSIVDAQAAVEVAQANLDGAQSALDLALSGESASLDPDAVAAMEALIEEAKTRLKIAKDELNIISQNNVAERECEISSEVGDNTEIKTDTEIKSLEETSISRVEKKVPSQPFISDCRFVSRLKTAIEIAAGSETSIWESPIQQIHISQLCLLEGQNVKEMQLVASSSMNNDPKGLSLRSQIMPLISAAKSDKDMWYNSVNACKIVTIPSTPKKVPLPPKPKKGKRSSNNSQYDQLLSEYEAAETKNAEVTLWEIEQSGIQTNYASMLQDIPEGMHSIPLILHCMLEALDGKVRPPTRAKDSDETEEPLASLHIDYGDSEALRLRTHAKPPPRHLVDGVTSLLQHLPVEAIKSCQQWTPLSTSDRGTLLTSFRNHLQKSNDSTHSMDEVERIRLIMEFEGIMQRAERVGGGVDFSTHRWWEPLSPSTLSQRVQARLADGQTLFPRYYKEVDLLLILAHQSPVQPVPLDIVESSNTWQSLDFGDKSLLEGDNVALTSEEATQGPLIPIEENIWTPFSAVDYVPPLALWQCGETLQKNVEKNDDTEDKASGDIPKLSPVEAPKAEIKVTQKETYKFDPSLLLPIVEEILVYPVLGAKLESCRMRSGFRELRLQISNNLILMRPSFGLHPKRDQNTTKTENKTKKLFMSEISASLQGLRVSIYDADARPKEQSTEKKKNNKTRPTRKRKLISEYLTSTGLIVKQSNDDMSVTQWLPPKQGSKYGEICRIIFRTGTVIKYLIGGAVVIFFATGETMLKNMDKYDELNTRLSKATKKLKQIKSDLLSLEKKDKLGKKELEQLKDLKLQLPPTERSVSRLSTDMEEIDWRFNYVDGRRKLMHSSGDEPKDLENAMFKVNFDADVSGDVGVRKDETGRLVQAAYPDGKIVSFFGDGTSILTDGTTGEICVRAENYATVSFSPEGSVITMPGGTIVRGALDMTPPIQENEENSETDNNNGEEVGITADEQTDISNIETDTKESQENIENDVKESIENEAKENETESNQVETVDLKESESKVDTETFGNEKENDTNVVKIGDDETTTNKEENGDVDIAETSDDVNVNVDENVEKIDIDKNDADKSEALEENSDKNITMDDKKDDVSKDIDTVNATGEDDNEAKINEETPENAIVNTTDEDRNITVDKSIIEDTTPKNNLVDSPEEPPEKNGDDENEKDIETDQYPLGAVRVEALDGTIFTVGLSTGLCRWSKPPWPFCGPMVFNCLEGWLETSAGLRISQDGDVLIAPVGQTEEDVRPRLPPRLYMIRRPNLNVSNKHLDPECWQLHSDSDMKLFSQQTNAERWEHRKAKKSPFNFAGDSGRSHIFVREIPRLLEPTWEVGLPTLPSILRLEKAERLVEKRSKTTVCVFRQMLEHPDVTDDQRNWLAEQLEIFTLWEQNQMTSRGKPQDKILDTKQTQKVDEIQKRILKSRADKVTEAKIQSEKNAAAVRQKQNLERREQERAVRARKRKDAEEAEQRELERIAEEERIHANPPPSPRTPRDRANTRTFNNSAVAKDLRRSWMGEIEQIPLDKNKKRKNNGANGSGARGVRALRNQSDDDDSHGDGLFFNTVDVMEAKKNAKH